MRSSDLELARQLAQTLTSRLGNTQAPVAASGHAWVRVAARVAAPVQPPTSRRVTEIPPGPVAPAPVAPAAPPARALPDPPTEGFPTWEMFLKWCLQASGGGSACVVDGEGFAIAFLGGLSPDNFEGLGAELSLAMQQFERIDMLADPLEAAALLYGSRWLTGIRGASEGEDFVLGLISEEPVARELRAALVKEFVAVLPQLA